jgi:glycosyltransferase involved in cell wall biosynthesis
LTEKNSVLARVLFICPVPPRPADNGLAIRASVSLEGLSRTHDTSVAIVGGDGTSAAWARGNASDVLELGLDGSRAAARSWLSTARGREAAVAGLPDLVRQRPPVVGNRIADAFGSSFDAMLVMRVDLAGVALPFLEAGVPALLDADDDEVSALRSMACFDPALAARAAGYETFQRVVFPWFERVLFAGPDDALPPRIHLPNAVRIPPTWATRAGGTPLELLFVGTSGYGPNRDAVNRLRERIMPAIAARGVEARLLYPDVDEDLEPYYQRAHIAVVPLRSGGGTRIKILEAFAHGCPVVSTPTGAHGLAVSDDRHLVLTATDDDDDAFANTVVSLASDYDRRARLAAAARHFVSGRHERTAVGDRLASLIDEIAR